MATASTRIGDLGDEELIKAAGSLHGACLAGDYDSVRSILLAHPPSDGIPLAALQDPDGFTALHAAAENGDASCIELLLSYQGGAQWAMPDNCGHTAGDVAFSAQRTDAYRLIHDHAVRSLLLHDALSSKATDDDRDDDDDRPMSNNPKAFLASRLRFSRTISGPVCVDADGNGVMMGWETPLMNRTADALCYRQGLDVLNIGFGLGIVDAAFQRHKPSRHVIVEPHPDVLRYLYRVWLPSRFSADAPTVLPIDDDTPVEDLANDPQTRRRLNELNIEVFHGRWQDFLDSEMLLSTFDVVYWDTFSEDYAALVDFIPSIPKILSGSDARWSFFHGLGADSRLLYDVHTTLVEAEIRDAGMSVEWEDVEVPDLGEVEWKDVVKRYWDIPAPYRLAICRVDPCDET